MNDFKALHLRAVRGFTDVYGKVRKAGEEWLVTNDMSSCHIIDVYEEYVGEVRLTVLTKHTNCIVLDPIDPTTGKNKQGASELRVGESSFFLQPGERLSGGIRRNHVLGED